MTRILPILAVAVLLIGCVTTVTSPIPEARQASFDAGVQNSGLIGFEATTGHGIITAHARDRYNDLIAKYGDRFHPPLHTDAGICVGATNGTFRIDSEHLADFIDMNRWRREGK